MIRICDRVDWSPGADNKEFACRLTTIRKAMTNGLTCSEGCSIAWLKSDFPVALYEGNQTFENVDHLIFGTVPMLDRGTGTWR